MTNLMVAVSFVDDVSVSPNLGARHAASRADIYWRCIFVALVSAKIMGGPDIEPVVFHDQAVPAAYRDRFAAFGIRHVKIDFSFRPPAAFSDTFVGSLYVLDAIAWFAAQARDTDKLAIIDPDCFINGSLAPLTSMLDEVEACIYALRFPRDYFNNGHSLNSIERWLAEQEPHLPRPRLRALGGEFLALTGAGARKLAALNGHLWAANLRAFAGQRPYLRTEEHMLTAAFAQPDLTRRDVGGEIVRRVWTTRSYANLDRLSRDLPVWHLPAEKHRGFAVLYNLLATFNDDQMRALLNDRAAMEKNFGLCGRKTESLIREIYMSSRRMLALVKGSDAACEDHS